MIWNLFWWRKRRLRKAEEDRLRAEAIAEHIAVRRPVHRIEGTFRVTELYDGRAVAKSTRAPKLKPVVKHLPRRWDDDPSLPSSEVSWTPVNVEPPTITFDPPSAPADPPSFSGDGGSSGGGGADGTY